MTFSLALLSKKAIDAALKANWQEAVDINTHILEVNPDNIEAKIRLGRALIQTRRFDKAQKLFREVLKIDPINPVARRNYDLAKQCKAETKGQIQVDTHSLLKEPGTTSEASLFISAKGITSKDFVSGENLILRVKKHAVDVYKCHNDEKTPVGTITDEDIVQRLNTAVEKNARIGAGFLKGENKNVTILIKSSLPIFRAEKQEIRPYLRKGTLDEPELEVEEEVVLE
jgi:tetratricopeptide (TPR) repeat protein